MSPLNCGRAASSMAAVTWSHAIRSVTSPLSDASKVVVSHPSRARAL